MDTLPPCIEPLPVDFPGRAKFIDRIDASVALGDPRAVTSALRHALSELIRDAEIVLPAQVHAPIVEHYARRELYRSPQHGYSVVAMT